jgi:hypothetical protein
MSTHGRAARRGRCACARERTLPSGLGAGRGWPGHRLSGLGQATWGLACHQGDETGQLESASRALRCRGPHARAAAAPEPARRARCRRGRRASLHGDGARVREPGRPHDPGGAARTRCSLHHRRSGGRGPLRDPRGRRRAPRHQAGQHPGGLFGQAAAVGLRHRADPRRAAHASRCDDGHAAVHGARTARLGRSRRRSGRHLRAGSDAVHGDCRPRAGRPHRRAGRGGAHCGPCPAALGAPEGHGQRPAAALSHPPPATPPYRRARQTGRPCWPRSCLPRSQRVTPCSARTGSCPSCSSSAGVCSWEPCLSPRRFSWRGSWGGPRPDRSRSSQSPLSGWASCAG